MFTLFSTANFAAQPRRFALATIAFAALLAGLATAAHAQTPYKVLDRWKVGGTGTWSSLAADGENGLLYVTHSTRVEVLSTRTGKPAGAVTGLQSAKGVALDPDGEVGYISDGAANAVIAFDRKTFATLDSIPAGTSPDAIVFEPTTRSIWAFNTDSQNVTVIDTRDRHILGTTKLPGKPGFARADAHGSVFVTIRDTNKLSRLAAASREITDTWQLDGCSSPSGLAYDEPHHRLFAACSNGKLTALDAHNGKQLASTAMSDSTDALVFAAKGDMLLAAGGTSGTLRVLDARPGKNLNTVETLPTQQGARTLAYQAQTDRVYLPSADVGPAPTPTPENPHPEAPIVPDSFTILVVGRR